MAPIEDHLYMKLCAELASCLSISLASARRKVELVAARDGVKNLNNKKDIAERLLKEARSHKSSGDVEVAAKLDELLRALAEEENFMVED
ncbi:hypothetical protein [Prochlorococcus sp. MIT 1307]|uniref:hypothetical protein n=1 Tax=Prochlorococcus sp. MIT 1307 TaxID=3096219 RepID=UPI002A7586C0|nr:hypothetical protein [Prochlorococcus sp. MIT 1307]